jgi:Transposase DDE domain
MATALATLLRKTPLAESVWLLWNDVVPDPFLNELYHSHRGRCFEHAFTFANIVYLVNDALLRNGGRAHPTLIHHQDSEQCPATQQAFYSKLRRMPIPLSEAFLAVPTQRLRSFLPNRPFLKAPESLRDFRITVFDGKTFKNAAKRLKAVRGRAGRGLGGRALVAMELTTGLLVGMAAHPDAHINEAKLVPDLLQTVRTHLPGTRLFVADRGFGDLAQMRRCTEEGDHCVLRLHKKSRFDVDPAKPARHGVDDRGRAWIEEIGTLHSIRQGSMTVRRITLERQGQDALVLVTDLLDGERHPANDLLALYRERWGIEQVFQKVTEVFHLSRLIGSSPKAIIFQASFCMLLYNLLQVIRAIIADTQDRAVATVSAFRVFEDLQEQLTVVHFLTPADQLIEFLRERAAAITDLVAYLHKILGEAWTKRWIKSSPKKRNLKPIKHQRGTGGHFSIHRVLIEHEKGV